MTDNWFDLLNEHLDRLARAVTPEAGQIIEVKGGERREVVILFLDIVGFTKLSEKLQDPERVYHIIAGVFATFTDVIKKHHGYVDKYIGDAIMAIWGAEQATEFDSERAVVAASEIFDTLEKINDVLKSIKVSINARIGINVGSAVFVPDPNPDLDTKNIKHWTVIGDAVNTASRIESKAKHGTILLSQSVRERAGEAFLYADEGHISVKGKKLPLHVFSITGKGPGRKNPWERVALVQKSAIVGRDKELKLLHDILSAEVVPNLRGFAKHRVIGIKGEAGLGKSRLLHEFTKGLNASILRGQTLSYAQPPYWLWTKLIRDYFGISEGDSNGRKKLDAGVQRLVSGLRNYQTLKLKGNQKNVKSMDATLNKDIDALQNNLMRNKPFLGELLNIPYEDERFETLDDEAKKLETQLSLRYLLRAIAYQGQIKNNQRYLIVILDDYQWIDSVSAEALLQVLQETDTLLPIFFLCAYRMEGVLSQAHSNYVISEEIEILPIKDSDCINLIHSMLGEGGLPEEVEKFILERASGNPFYLEEVVLSLVGRGIVAQESGKWELLFPLTGQDVPLTVNTMILSRIDGLDPVLKEVLKRASVVGREFLLRVLHTINSKLSDMREIDEKTEHYVDLLTKVELILKTPAELELGYHFKNAITRDVTYSIILHHNRRLLHRIVAEVMEELFPDSDHHASLIADHWEKAELYRNKAITWGIKALKYYEKHYQNVDGLVWADKLTSWLESEPENQRRYELLLDIWTSKEKIQGLLGLNKDRRLTLDLMLVLCDKWSFDSKRGDVLNSYGSLNRLQGQMDEALSCFQQALDIYRKVGDRKGEGHILGSLGALHKSQGRMDEVLDCYRQALDIHREVGNHKGEGSTLGNIAIFYQSQGQKDEALKHYIQALDIQRDIGNRRGEGLILSNLGYLHFTLVHIDEALECYQQALDIRREIGDRSGEGHVIGNLGILYRSQNRMDKTIECYQQALVIHREVGDRRNEGLVLGNMGIFYQNQGQFDEALQHYQQGLNIRREIRDQSGEGQILGSLGALHQAQGNNDEALRCYQKSLEILKNIGNRRTEGHVLGYLGNLYLELNANDKALKCYQQALDVHREVGDRRSEESILSKLNELNLPQTSADEAKRNNRETSAINREIISERTKPL